MDADPRGLEVIKEMRESKDIEDVQDRRGVPDHEDILVVMVTREQQVPLGQQGLQVQRVRKVLQGQQGLE